MKGLTKKYLLIIISLALSAGVFKPVEAAGNCSPYLGLATINELFRNKTNQTDDPADFVEIKILDSSIPLPHFHSGLFNYVKITARATIMIMMAVAPK